MIDYKVSEDQFNDMVQRIFVKKEQIGTHKYLKYQVLRSF